MGVHWSNFALSLLCSRLSLTKQLRFVSGEHSGMIQTLIVTQREVLHLMPRCEILCVTKAERCSWGFSTSTLLLLLLHSWKKLLQWGNKEKNHLWVKISEMPTERKDSKTTEHRHVRDTMRILCNWHRRKQKHARWIYSSFTAILENHSNAHIDHMVPGESIKPMQNQQSTWPS